MILLMQELEVRADEGGKKKEDGVEVAGERVYGKSFYG